MEAQIPLDRAQVFGGRNEIGCSWRVHDLMLPVYRLTGRTPDCCSLHIEELSPDEAQPELLAIHAVARH
jgi:hypothetical protein